MTHMITNVLVRSVEKQWLLLVISLGLLALPHFAECAVYGVKDAAGRVVPKIEVSVSEGEFVVEKAHPDEKFSSISFTVNKKNLKLGKNVKQLNVQWIAPGPMPGKPLPFVGPRYDASKMVFKDSMGKSIAVKILDKSRPSLFKGKKPADLFEIRIDDQICVETEQPGEKVVRLGQEPAMPVEVNRQEVMFNEQNFKTGMWIDVDNRSGLDQVVSVTFPERGLVYKKVVRKLEQAPIPEKEWSRFTLAKDTGVSLLVIPDPEPAELDQLPGQGITINVFQGGQVKQTINLPIRVASGLDRVARGADDRALTPTGPEAPPPVTSGTVQKATAPRGEPPVAAQQGTSSARIRTRESGAAGSFWLWLFQILNLGVLLVVAGYGIFFILPRIQVLEDRLAKNEMFIHGSREAIREELDEIKREILQQCQVESPSE